MMEQEIEQKLAELAKARANLQYANEVKDAILQGAKETDAYREAEATKLSLSRLIEELEADVKAWGLVNFDGTNKAVHPNVTIKTFDTSRAVYEPTTAFIWCLSNFTPALRLDAKTFEKAALAGTIPAQIALVVPEKENRAQIATDLSEYLE